MVAGVEDTSVVQAALVLHLDLVAFLRNWPAALISTLIAYLLTRSLEKVARDSATNKAKTTSLPIVFDNYCFFQHQYRICREENALKLQNDQYTGEKLPVLRDQTDISTFQKNIEEACDLHFDHNDDDRAFKSCKLYYKPMGQKNAKAQPPAELTLEELDQARKFLF